MPHMIILSFNQEDYTEQTRLNIKNLLQQADIDHVNYSSHSLRIGATTTAAAAAVMSS